jgi:electron transfer flavoprotein alpha subunit
MKAAVVLYTDTPSIMQQAGEINILLAGLASRLEAVEPWFFYRDQEPASFPDIPFSLAGMELTAVEKVHMPESFLLPLVHIYRRRPVDLLLFAGDGLGDELATRLAYRLGGSSCLHVEKCRMEGQTLEVETSAYWNHLTARFTLGRMPYCLSAANIPCRPAEAMRGIPTPIVRNAFDPIQDKHIRHYAAEPDRTDTGLDTADIVLAVGSGAGSKKNVDALEAIAGNLGAQLGASRPVVMSAWTDMGRLLGASGLNVSPSVCIASGVSGVAAFSMGIRNSAFIVAVNTDENAPIFQIADVGVVEDQMAVLTELEKLVKSEKAKK